MEKRNLLIILVALSLTGCTTHARAKMNLVHKPAPGPGVVAKISGEEITETTLESDRQIEFFELRMREYDLKMDRLTKMIIDKLTGAEAKKAGMDMNAYLDKKLADKMKVTDKDFKKFLTEKKVSESQVNPQLKERIFANLAKIKRKEAIQDYAAKLTKDNPVEVYFGKPKMMDVNIGQAPVWGKEDAPVTIIEFSDFQCPYCAKAAETVDVIRKKYAGKIRLVYKHFPLPMHHDAPAAAEASMCVYDQGPDKFWKFYDLAFKNHDKLDPASLAKYAAQAGADAKLYDACNSAHKFAPFVEADKQYGEKLGVTSTPTFIINGTLMSGAYPVEQFSDLIDDELSEKTAQK